MYLSAISLLLCVFLFCLLILFVRPVLHVVLLMFAKLWKVCDCICMSVRLCLSSRSCTFMLYGSLSLSICRLVV